MNIIENGTICDGLSDKPFKGSVIIAGSKIVEINRGQVLNYQFCKTINARGKIVLPGFIDIHSHADLIVYEKPGKNPKLRQGVTTEIIGNCGFSIIMGSNLNFTLYNSNRHTRLGDWIKMWEGIWGRPPAGYPSGKTVQNVLSLVGYGALRYKIAGFENRPLTKKETALAKNIISGSIKNGAAGLSFGLIYAPCAYASKEELVEMAKAAARAGGYLAVHMRNEGDGVVEALNETIEIAKRAGARLEISHMKAYGKKNWHKMDDLLEIIEKENSRGFEVNFDMYPYIAGSTTLSTLIPNWVKEGGKEKFLKRIRDTNVISRIISDIENGIPGWENLLLENVAENITAVGLKSGKYRRYEGADLWKISKAARKNVVGTVCDILLNEEGGGEMLMFGMCEKNIVKGLKSRYSMIGTDGLFGGRPHPRTYGTYPRIIEKYVLKDKVITMAEAVQKISVMPAQKARLSGRGALKPGNFADIVIIDPKKIRENSTFDNPSRYPSGIDHILINGRII